MSKVRQQDVCVVGNTQGAFPGYANAGSGDAYLMRLRMDTHEHHEKDCEGDEDED
jgi:hypothetical protein